MSKAYRWLSLPIGMLIGFLSGDLPPRIRLTFSALLLVLYWIRIGYPKDAKEHSQ